MPSKTDTPLPDTEWRLGQERIADLNSKIMDRHIFWLTKEDRKIMESKEGKKDASCEVKKGDSHC